MVVVGVSTSTPVVAVVVSRTGVVVKVVVTVRASSVAGIIVEVTISMISLTTWLAYETDSEMLFDTETLTSQSP